MKNFLLILCAVLCLTAAAQDNFAPVFKEINNEVQNNSKAYATLKDASESIGHRLTGLSKWCKSRRICL
jgi:hypothetical protein